MGLARTARVSNSGGNGTGLPPGWVSVATYGALGDGVTNDSASFLLARDTGQNVLIPSGTLAAPKHYLVAAPNITPLQGQLIKQDGSHSYGSLIGGGGTSTAALAEMPTCLLNVGQTGWVFNLSGMAGAIEGIIVRQHSAYLYPYIIADVQADTQAHCGHFLVGNMVTNAWQNQLTNCASLYAYNAFEFTSGPALCNHTEAFKLTAIGAINAGFYLDLPTPAGDLRLAYAKANSCGYSLRIKQCDTSSISNFHSATARWKHFWYEASKGEITHVNILGGTAEGISGTANVHTEMGSSGGVYNIYDCSIQGMEFYGKAYPTISDVILGSKCLDVGVSNCQLYSTRLIDNGKGSKIAGNTIAAQTGQYAGYGVGTGLDMGATSSDCIYTGNMVKMFEVGANINAGSVGWHTITGNNFRNNQTATTGNFGNTARAGNQGLV